MSGKTVLIWILVMAVLVPLIVGLYKWRDVRRAKWEATWGDEAAAIGLTWAIEGEARAEAPFPGRLGLMGTCRGRTVEVSQHHFSGNTEGDPGTWVTKVGVKVKARSADGLPKSLKKKAYQPPAISRGWLVVQRKGKHRKAGQLSGLVNEVCDAAEGLEAG